MSYILDALKKLEKERQRGVVPELTTVQDVMPPQPKKRSLWPYLLLVALLLNAGVLVVWFVPWQLKKTKVVTHSVAVQQVESKGAVSSQPGLSQTLSPGVKPAGEESAPEVESTMPKPAADKGDIVKQKQPGQAEAETQRKAPGKPTPPEPKPTDTPVAAVENRVYNLNEVPPSIQQSLPAFIISVCIYSQDPVSRMAKINGKAMREGEYLSAGLKLEEITPDGVIFSYQNYRFRVGLK